MEADTTPIERGIPFAGRLVCEIHEDRKNQTRRPISLKPGETEIHQVPSGRFYALAAGIRTREIKSRYGYAGDILYIRETWKPDVSEPEIAKSGCNVWTMGTSYRADDAFIPIENTEKAADLWMEQRRVNEQYPANEPAKWRPSLHMPKWVHRTKLLITGVRVEALQIISEEDARNEGPPRNWTGPDFTDYDPDEHGYLDNLGLSKNECFYYYCDGRTAFKDSWDRHYGGDQKKCWDSNPFVFVYNFERMQ